MRVFVTDGDNRASLAVTRALGRAGHEVLVGERTAPALAHTSRYCADRVVYPDPVTASDAFVDFLVDTVKARRVDVLLPVADITTLLVTSHQDRFKPGCAIPFARAAVVARAADKIDIVHTAEALGVGVPRGVVVTSCREVPELDLGWPVVIKPQRSRARTSGGWASSAVSFAADREGLLRDLSARPAHEFPLLVQERIVGSGLGLFACYQDGRPVALFSHRRLRERPPWGGVSVLSESTPLDPVLAESATRLLSEIGWHGVAMVEFKQDERDGKPKLMEINGRFWGSLQLAIDSGVNFPELLVRSTQPGRVEPQKGYRVGVRSRWFWGDVDSLLLTFRGSHRVAGVGRSSRMRALLSFLDLWGRDLHYENPKAYDLGPFLFESRGWLRKAARRTGASVSSVVVGAAAAAEIAPRLDQIGLDATQWNALAATSAINTVFQTYQWTQSWWSTFGDHYEPLFAVLSDTSGVIGLAPLVVERSLARERVARFLGDGRADYSDFLAADGRDDTRAALCDTVLASRRWDILELNNVPGHSPTVEIMRASAKRAGFSVIVEDQFVCPTLLIQGHEEEATRTYEKASLRRRQNYFEHHGRLVCRDLTTRAEVEPFLEAFFAQHVGRWQGSGNPSLFVNARNRTFYTKLTASLDGTGWLLFSVVEFNERPIAFHYGFDYDGVVTWYKPSFDIAHAPHSPGLVLLRHLLGYAIGRDRKELDFTVGDEPFKTRFTNSARKTVRIRVFRDTVRFMLERSRQSIVTAVKRASLG